MKALTPSTRLGSPYIPSSVNAIFGVGVCHPNGDAGFTHHFGVKGRGETPFIGEPTIPVVAEQQQQDSWFMDNGDQKRHDHPHRITVAR
jgi:hypothetical protein